MHPEDIPENRKQLRDIIFSTYPACTEPDVEGDGRKFVVRAYEAEYQLIDFYIEGLCVHNRRHKLVWCITFITGKWICSSY